MSIIIINLIINQVYGCIHYLTTPWLNRSTSIIVVEIVFDAVTNNI